MRNDYTYSDYTHWMREQGRDAIQAHQAQYVTRFEGCSLVLDIGCGEGLFLELLKRAGIRSLGVDREPEIVAKVRAAGMDVKQGDALSFLKGHPQEYDGVYCSHLIEHMPFEGVVQLVRAAAESLCDNGRLLMVFPNPESIRMQCFGFWKDPEHVRFYHADLVRSICQQMGLQAEVLRPKPLEEPLSPPRLEGFARDWAPLDLDEPYRVFRQRMEEIRDAIAKEEEETALQSAAPSGRWKRLLEKVGRALIPQDLPNRQDLLFKRQNRLQDHLEALHDFADSSVMSLCRWHETQSQLAGTSIEEEGRARESFNQSLGRLIQTLNSAWGVPEEAAVLAVKCTDRP